jgi:hypothetical protein
MHCDERRPRHGPRQQSRPLDALNNHNEPSIHRPAIWLLCGQLDQLGRADHLMQLRSGTT